MRRNPVIAALLGVGLLLSGCGVGMPTSGAIHHAGAAEHSAAPPAIAIDPLPPQRGASPTQVVQGFLDAMLATPTQTHTARAFLTRDAAAAWNPGAATITYGEKSPPGGGGMVTVDLSDANRFDARGAWQGRLTAEESRLTFPMVKQQGQWRISSAPNALVVPQSWFQSRYTQANLYWFDQTGRILVPEPVYVPLGSQMATTLVRDLAQGPSPQLAGSVRTFLPPNVGGGLSVPVSPGGIAQVAFTGGPQQSPETPQALALVRAQLAWTLRQDRTVHAIQVSIDGRDVPMNDGRTQFSVTEGSTYDPAGYQTNPRLFALSKGLLVSGQRADTLRPVDGPFGTTPHALASFAVDPWAGTVAAVTADRHSLLLGPVHDQHQPERVISRAGSLLRPAWDTQGRLWLVDARPAGAQVSYLDHGGQRHQVVAPGITGADVRRFLVSRDGARLVAVVHTAGGDAVVASLLRSDDTGTVVAASPAQTISPPDDSSTSIRDIAWASPTQLFLLHRLATTSQLRKVSIDGSSIGIPTTPITIGEAVDGLVSAPLPDSAQYVWSGPRLLGLSPSALDVTMPTTVQDLTYVG